MFKKNDIIKLNIVDINQDGLGVAKLYDDINKKYIVFFVKNAIIDDYIEGIITKVTTNIIYVKTLKILSQSKFRITSNCSVCDRCGGCQVLNIEYNKQVELKENIIKNNLLKIGKIEKSIIDRVYQESVKMDFPYYFRNKIILPFTKNDNKIIYGYFASRTHYIIENKNCITAFKNHNLIADILVELLVKFNISIYDEKTKTGIFRQLMLRRSNELNNLSITFIVNDNDYLKNIALYKKLSNKLVELYDEKIRINNIDDSLIIKSISLNINTSPNNVLLSTKSINIYGDEFILDKMSLSISNNVYSLFFNISYLSFYQTNIFITKKLYQIVFEFADIQKNETVLDLYCGIGTLTLFSSLFSKKSIGVEVVEKAVNAATINAKLNNITNCSFICQDLDNNLLFGKNDILFKNQYDVLIVDPPRKGLSHSVKNYIINTLPHKIVYVSCDSATLSRDLFEILNTNRYELKKIKFVDMFPHTMHVETVCLLSNRKPDARVKIDVDLEDYYRIKDEQKKNKASE